MMEKINFYLIKPPYKYISSGWISPDGKCYKIDFAEHESFAVSVMKEVYGDNTDDLYVVNNASTKLIEYGWVSFGVMGVMGILLRGLSQMTKKQYKVLYSIFGESREFANNYTITELYEIHLKEIREGKVKGNPITKPMVKKDPFSKDG